MTTSLACWALAVDLVFPPLCLASGLPKLQSVNISWLQAQREEIFWNGMANKAKRQNPADDLAFLNAIAYRQTCEEWMAIYAAAWDAVNPELPWLIRRLGMLRLKLILGWEAVIRGQLPAVVPLGRLVEQP